MIFRSTYPDVDIPDVSVPALVLKGAAALGTKPALIDGPTGRTLSYGDLATSVRQAAANLARRGLPKGVMLTHRTRVANIVQTSAVVQATEREVAMAVLPFYHIYGFTVLLNISLYQGVTIVTMPRFDLELFLRLMQDYAITRANVVPPIVLALARHPLVAQNDLHALLSISSGAAPLDASVEQACGDRLKCFVAQGYGLTETSPVVSTTPLAPAKRRGGSPRLPTPNTP